MKRSQIFFFTLLTLLFIIIFLPWFKEKEIVSGDWPYYYEEMVSEFSAPLPLWHSQEGIGVGGISKNFPFFSYQNIIIYIFVNTLHIPWNLIYKAFWFGLFIFLSIFSITTLIRTFLKDASFWQIALLCSLIYTANTYILMIVGGGQMGIALAYSVAPLVLARFVRLLDFLSLQSLNFKFQISNYQLPITAALVFALQVMFDIRIAYLTMGIVFLYVLFYYLFIKKFHLKLFAICYLLFAIIVMGLHAYWLVPFFAFNLFSLPEGITSPQGFQFFSFADFSHALSLLHPNWPENIFGKTYFLQPEFLMLPILAYSSLLFISLKLKTQNFNTPTIEQLNNRTIIFFALLGILGAFLSKGVNPPVGEVNHWLFQYIPGMNLFRDPTKFYIMIALSYSILIPFSVYSIYEILNSKSKIKNYLPNLFLLLVTSYLFLLIRPAWMGELMGTFKPYQVPQEYIELKDFIVSQPEFFRTLWVPTQSRFRFQNEEHPLINAETLFKTANISKVAQKFHEEGTEDLLEKLAIKYVIIPYDATGEIFLEDRKYDESKRVALEDAIDAIPYLKKVSAGAIAVYETSRHSDHFWLTDNGSITYKRLTGTEYKVTVSSQKETTLTFSEQFHPHWNATVGNTVMKSTPTEDGFNSFAIPQGEHEVHVYFEPQKWAYYSYVFSLGFLLGIVVLLMRLRQ